MKILIVSQYFWPESFRINDLVSNFSKRGHEVTVLTGLPNYPEGILFPAYRSTPEAFDHYEDVAVVRVPHVLRGKGKIGLVLNYLTFFLNASLTGAWKLRKSQFDVVFVYAVSPITAAIPAIVQGRLKNAKVFLWVLDLWPETLSAVGVVRSPRLLSIIGVMVAWIYKRCDYILIQSRAFLDSVNRHCPNNGTSNKILYFPSWAEDVFSQGIGAKQDVVVRDDRLFTVMFAGNIGEAQDFPAILDAIEILKMKHQIRWVIIGDGRLREWVAEQIRSRGLEQSIYLVGRFPVESMPSFFACADALLVTLKTNEIFARTIPGKVQAYLASGRPIIGMIDGEARAVIEESGGGMACASGASTDLAKIVDEMAGMSHEQLQQMGLKGRHFYEKYFDRDTLFTKLENYFYLDIAGMPLSEHALSEDEISEKSRSE
ncbi:MAG: glycosyltransferase family 4 protein [Glaciimonas sp.]|nr:glycosyltransferase family 4 protein [Glaciimonas sp.]